MHRAHAALATHQWKYRTYPCGECGNAVTFNSTACDICNTWHHRECVGMNLTTGPTEQYLKVATKILK